MNNIAIIELAFIASHEVIWYAAVYKLEVLRLKSNANIKTDFLTHKIGTLLVVLFNSSINITSILYIFILYILFFVYP